MARLIYRYFALINLYRLSGLVALFNAWIPMTGDWNSGGK